MKFKDYIKTAFKNLRRRKTRTLLTSFAVSIGTMLIILMVSLGVGVQKLVIDAIKANTPGTSITVTPYKFEEGIKTSFDSEEDLNSIKPKFKKIDNEAINKIRSMDKVDELSIIAKVPALDITLNETTKSTSSVLGYDLSYPIFQRSQIEATSLKEKSKDISPISFGRNLEKQEINVALVGERFLDKIGIKDYSSVLNKELTLKASLSAIPNLANYPPKELKLKVVGIINGKFSLGDKVIIPINSAYELLSYINMDNNYAENKGPDSLEINTKTIAEVGLISDEITKMDYGVTSIQSLIKGIKTVFAIAQSVLSIIGIIIIFVASIGVINTMTMSIYERTRSIGIMKALGASRKDIKWLFITESGVIGFLGGLMGLVFSYMNTAIIKFGLNLYLNSKGIKDIPTLFSTPLWLISATIGFAILISVLAGLYPASKASKLDPVESLRYE